MEVSSEQTPSLLVTNSGFIRRYFWGGKMWTQIFKIFWFDNFTLSHFHLVFRFFIIWADGVRFSYYLLIYINLLYIVIYNKSIAPLPSKSIFIMKLWNCEIATIFPSIICTIQINIVPLQPHCPSWWWAHVEFNFKKCYQNPLSLWNDGGIFISPWFNTYFPF